MMLVVWWKMRQKQWQDPVSLLLLRQGHGLAVERVLLNLVNRGKRCKEVWRELDPPGSRFGGERGVTLPHPTTTKTKTKLDGAGAGIDDGIDNEQGECMI